jgi:hypothetical protein
MDRIFLQVCFIKTLPWYFLFYIIYCWCRAVDKSPDPALIASPGRNRYGFKQRLADIGKFLFTDTANVQQETMRAWSRPAMSRDVASVHST